MTDFSKIGKKSKNKGKYGERRVASLLSEFTSKNFRKVPGSGGFNKQGVVVAEHIFTGDVICDDAGFLFSVESKNRYNDFSFAQLSAVPEKAPFTYWWYQTIDDANRANLFPLLFFKAAATSNGSVGAECIAMTVDALDRVGYPSDAPKIIFDIYHGPIDLFLDNGKGKPKKKVSAVLPTPIIINWRIFINHVDPSRMFK